MMAHQARRGHHVPQQHCQRHLICTPPIHILLKDKVGEVPENDDGSVLTGCCKEKGVTKFYDRTAGVLALVRPCGVIVNTLPSLPPLPPTHSHRCLQQLGRNHGYLVSTLVPELLSTHTFFMGKEPDVDDPACIPPHTLSPSGLIWRLSMK